MSWIVNILATLIYLGFGIIYAVGFSKRKHFRYSIVVTAAAIFLAQAGMFLVFQVENWFGAMMWMALGYVMMLLSLWVNVKMTMAVASYYAVWASCTWCLAYELSMVFCWLLRKRWEIPAEVMKMKRPHIVPLSEQVIMLFKQLEPISKHHPLVFIGRNDPRKPISKESINQVIELLGYKGRLTGHGFRHTMSTILHEQGFNSAWIEMQLAHVDKNSIRGTYNHALYLDGRREMMQWYADYIDSLSSRES